MTRKQRFIHAYPNILVFLAALHRKPLYGTPYANTLAHDALKALEEASGEDLDAELATIQNGSKVSGALEQRIQDFYREVFNEVMGQGLAPDH